MIHNLIHSVFMLCLVACAATSCDPHSTNHGYDVYLLIGQSNMAGRGTMLESDTVEAIPGVYLLNGEDKPTPAHNPLNQYSSIRKDIKMQQICPGTSFSQTLAQHTNRNILLVVNAKGGTALSEWMPGTKFFNEAVRRGKEAMKFGTLKGILWHQGCADSSPEKTATYLERLSIMVDSLRTNLGVTDEVPFIAGELAHWRRSSAAFNDTIHHIDRYIPGSHWVSAEGCTWLKDSIDPHFSREGQLLLGRRYAEKLLASPPSGGD